MRVDADLQEEEFEVDDEIVVDEFDGLDASAGTPVFHTYTRDGRSVHTLGPSYQDGGVVAVDHEAFTAESAISGEELPANSDAFPHPTAEKLYLTAGMATGPDGNADGVGEYYVLDTGTDTGGCNSFNQRSLVFRATATPFRNLQFESSRTYSHQYDGVVYRGETDGSDAHALWIAPDGDELWILIRTFVIRYRRAVTIRACQTLKHPDGHAMPNIVTNVRINRETNDGVIVDPETDEVVDEVPAFGPAQSGSVDQRDAPKSLSFSPDGKYVFASLRGPLSISTDPPVPAGVTPGVAVLDAATRERQQVIEPDPIDGYSREDIEAAFAGEEGAPAIPDFGGLGVRPTDDFDGYTAPPYGNNTS